MSHHINALTMMSSNHYWTLFVIKTISIDYYIKIKTFKSKFHLIIHLLILSLVLINQSYLNQNIGVCKALQFN